VEVKYTGGDPRVVFYDENRNEISEEINLSEMDVPGIHSLLESRGIKLKVGE